MPDAPGEASHERHATLVTGTRNNAMEGEKQPKGKNAVVYSSFPHNPAE